MKIIYSFHGKKPYTHTADQIKQRLDSLLNEKYPNAFSISNVHLTINEQKILDSKSFHSYSISFDCQVNSRDLENEQHIAALSNFLNQDNVNVILDSKKAFTMSQVFIGQNISAPAFQKLSDEELSIDGFFASSCAKKLDYCRTILESNVVAINIEYERTGDVSGVASGKTNMKLLNRQKASFDDKNPHHAFAAAILNNATLRQMLLSEQFENLSMKIDENNDLIFKMKVPTGVVVSAPIKNVAPASQSVTSSSMFPAAHDGLAQTERDLTQKLSS